METVALLELFAALFVLLLLSACFSGSETAMMALNRYRLRHMAAKKHSGAIKARDLLGRPDRLIGLLLVGNTFCNAAVSSIATVIGLTLVGEARGVAAATVTVGVVTLILAEVMPKTIAALYPERIAFRVSHVLKPLLSVTYPLVWVLNSVANNLLNRSNAAQPRGTSDSRHGSRRHHPTQAPANAVRRAGPGKGHGRRHHDPAQ